MSFYIMDMKKKSTYLISIVTPFYNEEASVEQYFRELIKVLKPLKCEFEIICVDDGSIDETNNLLLKEAKSNRNVKVIKLSRNFGKEAALSAGIDAASGDAVIPFDADLQDPPSLIPEMISKWEEGYKVVLAQRKSRNDKIFKKISAALYYKIAAYLTSNHMPQNVGDFRLMDKEVILAVRALKERNRFMKGILSWVGFKTFTLQYKRPERIKGESHLSFSMLLRLALDGLFSFSSKPLKVWLYLGLVISLLSFSYACYLILRTLILGVDLPGYASIMVAVLFMGGIQLVSLGVIGEYIARIFKEVKQRPIYITEYTQGFDKNDGKKRAKK